MKQPWVYMCSPSRSPLPPPSPPDPSRSSQCTRSEHLYYTLHCDLWVQLHPITTPWSPRKSLIFSKQDGVTANFQALGFFSLMNKAVPHPSSPITLSKGMGGKCSLHACSIKKVFSLFWLGPGTAARSRKRVALEKSSEEPLSSEVHWLTQFITTLASGKRKNFTGEECRVCYHFLQLDSSRLRCRERLKGRKGQLRIRWLKSVTHSMDTNLSKLWGVAEDRGA